MRLWPVAACALALALAAIPAHAQTPPPSVAATVASTERDGSHDFDFEFGTWKAHIRRLLRPLTHSTAWATYDGTSLLHKIWDGRANIGELEVRGEAGHIEGSSFRLYDTQAHLYSRDATFIRPAAASVTAPVISLSSLTRASRS